MATVSIKPGTFAVGEKVSVYQGDNAKGPVLGHSRVSSEGVEVDVKVAPGTRVTVYGPRTADTDPTASPPIYHEVHSAAR